MDFEVPEEIHRHRMEIKLLKKEVEPFADEYDRASKFPIEVFDKRLNLDCAVRRS